MWAERAGCLLLRARCPTRWPLPLDTLGGGSRGRQQRRRPRPGPGHARRAHPEDPLVGAHASLIVRTDGDPARLAGPVRAAIREVLPRQPILQIVPMQDKVAAAAATPRFFTTLVSVFGALALTLAAVGLYGIVAYVVRQREREIGVRVALGATQAHVVGLMLRRGMAPVLAGLAVGIPLALFATRLLRSLLYVVSASDPVTFVVVAALLAAVALVASWLPSRRAARVDPTIALRAD